MTVQIGLVCWHCGAKKNVFASRGPEFAFELVGLAQEAGMVGYFDMGRGRALIFCNSDHARNEMTKAGQFRARPKGAAPSKVEDNP
jgi:hypothetical protein